MMQGIWMAQKQKAGFIGGTTAMWWALQILWAWPLIAGNGAGIKVTMRNNEACINRD